ncbi:FIG007959: peptidase, M16 family [hydrothermal vent metagenome]|uniref:FIG007959: peptidase, M16 family n=1 Tax=hydrothermal vent metagenome TaxID=652676 RepID=A0A3B1BGN9_9ZZZZ
METKLDPIKNKLNSESDFSKDTLQNGLRVITVPTYPTKSVTIMIMAAAGSRHEERRVNGISHFMEHMFFKGAKRHTNAMEVASAIDSVGGSFNAFTGEERVGYFVKLSAKKKKVAYDVVSDMLLNSKFEQEEIDRERGVIIEEIRMYNDDPMSRVQMDFKEHFYGDQPLGWDIAGPESVIQSVNRKDFIEYKDRHYSAANCVLVAAGGITHEENIAMAEQFFTFENHGTRMSATPFKKLEGKRSTLRKRDIEQAHFTLGFPIPGDEHEDQAALKIFNNALGGTMSSRLFYQIRERRGLAYYIRSARSTYVDTGALKVSAGINVAKLGDAIACVMDEIIKAAEEGITEDEFIKSRDNIKGRNDLALENSMSVAGLYAGHETLHGKIKTPEEITAEIDAVTLEQANAVAKKYLDPSQVRLAALGPYDDLETFDKRLDGV